MEELSDDDDVKDLASDWVKRIQNSLLTPGNDVRSPDVVRARFVSSDEPIHTNHEFRKENGKNYSNPRLESTYRVDSNDSVSFKQFPVHARASGVGEEHFSTFERTSKQSNVDRSSKSTVQDEILSKTTPRPDADFLRQKRLAFFDRSLELQEKEELSLFHDSNHNISKNTSASQFPPSDHEAHKYRSSIEQFSVHPSSYAKQETLKEMYQLDSMETPLSSSCSFNGGRSQCLTTDNFHYQHRSARAVETDEEDIRLELWGLKEAVHSGELDLNSYLKEPVWRGNSFFAASSQVENVYDDQSGDRTASPLHGETRHPKITDIEGYNQSYLNAASGEGGKTRNDDCHQHHLNYKATNCLPFVDIDEVSNTGEYSGPEPQINGPLYSGFENSDSETSLLSFGSKCDDVHYRKVLKKQHASIAKEHVSPRGKVHSIDKKQEHKLKQKRSKDKILMELTEFVEGCGTPKDSKHSKQSRISNDLHLRHPSDVPKADNDDSLLNEVTVGHTQNEFVKRDSALGLNADPLFSSSVSDGNIALSHDLYQKNGTCTSAPSENRRDVMGKICPKCSEVNSKAANWCIECGTALICIKASCLTAQQQKVFEKQCEETKTLIKETLKTPMNFSQLLAHDKADKEERLLSNDISNLSLQVSQSTSDLEEAKYSSSPHGYKRRWMRSSIAWSTYNSSELKKSPSFVKEQFKMRERERATSFSDLTTCSTKGKGSKHHKRNSRGKSARKRTVSCSSFGSGDDEAMKASKGFTYLKAFGYPQNMTLKSSHKELKQSQNSAVQRESPSIANQAGTKTSTKGRHCANLHNGMVKESQSCQSLLKSSSASSFDEKVRPSISQVAKTIVPPLNLQDVDSYDRILTLIRSQRDSEPVPYLYLPDEILLQIFSYLPHKDLVSCARVCSQFYRISMDETLWKVIVLRKNNNITDEWLSGIGKRRPISLTISQCHSDKVTAKGLRDLFRNCSDSLEELNFSSCRGGELIGESVLLHVAARCCWLKSVDASWSNVSDNGVQALVDNVKRLECLCLNGCQAVSDESIKCVANKHGKTLRIFEVFGCFNITPAGIRILGQACKQLQTLNIGQCHKITDSAISSLVSNLPELENLDLRGCKQIRDSAVKKIVRHCPLVTTLVLANCPLITNVSLAEIAANLPRIKSLDICGCSRVSDKGICALSRNCQRLELLDLTSTGVGHRSVLSLANYCSQSLCNLKLSFCTDISENTVVHLAKHCKRLTTLHLYGCKRIRNTSDLRLLNPALTIEC